MFINVRQRPNTVGLLVGADALTSVPTVRGGLLHALHIIRLFLLVGRHKARPLQWMGGAVRLVGCAGNAHRRC